MIKALLMTGALAFIAVAGAQSAPKASAPPTASKTATSASGSYVPLPASMQCSLKDPKLQSVAGENELQIQGGTVSGVACWVVATGPGSARDLPLASNDVGSGGFIRSKTFGTLRFKEMQAANRAGSEHVVFSIRRDRLQPLRAYLMKHDENAAAASGPASASPSVPGVPPVNAPVQTVLSLSYQDIEVGAGSLGETGKLWHLKYTGWRRSDGVKFDSWEQHPRPVMGSDGKPELGPDGKPKFGAAEPIALPQGVGAVIPGFDYGLAGMRIGGKRRIFIPWQLAYGLRGHPGTADHPGIPPKSDLVFDVELVEVTEMPAPQARPAMPPRPVPGAAPPSGTGSSPNTAPAQPPSAPPPPSQPKQPAATPAPPSN